MITNYFDYCLICGKPKTDDHHMVFGIAKRKLADEDHLLIPLCREHHEQMHNNEGMQAMSRICGQLLYERDKCAQGYGIDAARESFRLRYGKSYM